MRRHIQKLKYENSSEDMSAAFMIFALTKISAMQYLPAQAGVNTQSEV